MIVVGGLLAWPEFLLPLIPGSWPFGTDRNGFDGSAMTRMTGGIFLQLTSDRGGHTSIFTVKVVAWDLLKELE